MVVSNAIAEESKLVPLFSASGRLSYSAPNFLRFWHPGYIRDERVLESQIKLQHHVRSFTERITMGLESFSSDLFQGTKDLISKNGCVFEEDLRQLVFGAEDAERAIDHKFLVHKYLFESAAVIKDSQWCVSTAAGSGPYILRSRHDLEVLEKAKLANLKTFGDKVRSLLDGKSINLTPEEDAVVECLSIYALDFYLNCQARENPFKTLLEQAFMGIAFVGSQAEARALLQKLPHQPISISKPFQTSKEHSLLNNSAPAGFPKIRTAAVRERADFQSLTVWSIDPEGTTEVDDGISVQSVDERKARLFIHVADPSGLIPDEMDSMARARSESLYLPEVKIPMLPPSICDAATLVINETHPYRSTLTISCTVDLESGEISEGRIEPGVISKVNNISYERANELRATDAELSLLGKIASAHYQYRCRKGHYDLNFPRGQVKLDNRSLAVIIERDDSVVGSSRQLVSEAMVIAGRVAGEWFRDRGLIAPFRYHPGFVLNADTERLLRRKPESLSLLERYTLLKTLPSAAVDIQPRPHQSMGVDAYVKVTSPLRRYLDLYTHRLILERPKGVFEFMTKQLYSIFRQEQYLKRLSSASQRFWVDKHLRSQSKDAVFNLYILDHIPESIKHPEEMFLVHIDEMATNFTVRLRSRSRVELGMSVQARLINPVDPLLVFEAIK